MFPEYRMLISRLKNEDAHFSVLFQRHNELDHEVSREEARPAPDSIRLMKMKREKLHLKDEMQCILRSYSPGE
ncbi:YdcH family protein [Salmonella enterica]|nr:YdcH family protein [Salmonella enterica]EEH5466133.1 YdcH family protein [Salmonella enterica]EEH7555577.1 YdcH family protein [Salmonella enterica]EEO5639940.1 YdcH family protein [Salmonella enterica]EEQ0203909.1 YdcH family protein [Salmonella enterica]